MRHLTLAVFLTFIMGLAGCGDTADTGGDVDVSNEAMDTTAMDVAPDEGGDAATDEGSGDTPQWAVLEQNVVTSE